MQLPPTILSIDEAGKKDRKSHKLEKQKQKLRENGTDIGVSNPIDLTSSDVGIPDSELSDNSETEGVGGDITVAVGVDNPFLAVKSNDHQTKKAPVLRPPRTLETTLFDRLETMYGPSIKRMLDVQYRWVLSGPYVTGFCVHVYCIQNAFTNM